MAHDAPTGTGNRLIHEKSPYLLQHAHNPVDWHPWGDEAFERARREDRPVFLSIGYATCHWCHVMAHESFEDVEVAALMNDAFVCIKLDREERPDIDGVYMTVCQMMTGSGGWPLTIVMTPDRQPFFAATYIPRATRFGRMGMLELVPQIQHIWSTRRGELLDAARQITDGLQPAAPTDGVPLGRETLDLAYHQLHRSFDAQQGGFGRAPKFPTPHTLLFLLRHHHRTGDADALRMVCTTLEAMRRGGIHDQLGFGFHRYSTDERWLVPHFEKMLYDQAQIAVACLEAYQVTGDEAQARTARQIFAYVLRDLGAPEGGLYSAEDADSEGVEGKFYLWTLAQLQEALAPDDVELAAATFRVAAQGNFRDEASGRRTGANILHQGGVERQDPRLETIRERLLQHRNLRPRPSLDDKQLTDWNGLMIAALARGAQVLGDATYADAARRAAHFVRERMRQPDGHLLHRFRDGEAGIVGMLDDYAFMGWGLIELYEATFDPAHLNWALELTHLMLERFWDTEHGGLFLARADATDLLVRQKTAHDGAIPSGNSVALSVLLRLARISADATLEQRAEELMRAFSARIAAAPAAYTHMLLGLDFAIGPAHEVVVVADPAAPATRDVLRALQRPFLPNKVLLLRPQGDAPSELCRVAPFTADQKGSPDGPTIYVCQDFHCHRPTRDVGQALRLLDPRA